MKWLALTFLLFGLSFSCVNLSDVSTWGTALVNDSGMLYINENITLCTDTYYISNYTGVAQLLEFNASNIWLNCNHSIIDGIDGDGIAINITSLENITVENCSVRNFGMGYEAALSKHIRFANNSVNSSGTGFLLADTSHSLLADNAAHSIIYQGYYLSGGTNNTLLSNYVHSVVYYGFFLSSSTHNTFLNNSALNAQISFWVTSGSDHNNFTGSVACNNSPAYSRGFIIDSSHNNTLLNSTACDNYIGFLLTAASDNGFTHSESRDNDYGFYLQGASTGNSFTGNTIYGGSEYGIFMIFTAYANTFANTHIFNKTSYINQWATASQPNDFTNLTLAYNETIGIVHYPSLSVDGVDLQPATFITNPYFVSLNDSSEPQGSAPANITIYATNCGHPVLRAPGFQTAFPQVVDSGEIYPTILSCISGVANFNVSSFSGYAVAQAVTRLDISILPSNSTAYGTPVNVTCNASSDALINMYRNGTLVTSGPSSISYIPTPAAGSYNFTCNVTETANYTFAEASKLLMVSRINSSCSLTIVPSSPQTYGTAITATCACTNPEASATLWRNNGDVTLTENGIPTVIPGGTWDYVCNVTASENYTNASNSSTYTINPATPSLPLTASPGWSATSGTTTNVSCDFTDPAILLELYRDSVLVDSGYGHAGEVASLADGTYQYVCNTTGNENYTAGTSSDTLTITTAPSPSKKGAAEEVQLYIIASDQVPLGSEMLIVVQKEGGTTMPLARVVIRLGTSIVFDDYTDTWGRASFTPTSAGTYTIAATSTGFLPATGSFTVIHVAGCTADGDCAYNEKCLEGTCALVLPGDCGRYSNHRWIDYECCMDSGCPEGRVCRGHQCISEEGLEERCTSDSECAPGYACTSGACVSIQRPECTNSMDCLPGFECRSGSCIMKERAPDMPVETITPVEVADNGRPGPFENEVRAASTFALPAIIAIILILAWLLWRRRKKGPQPDEFAP